MIDWIKKNKIEAFFLVLIILAALFLRLYRIDEYMTFLGDEGRDVRIVRDLITKGNLVFIGPQTSIGNMYLGPLYYYMMAPALLLSNLNPVGPAIMNALLGTLTIFLTYYLGKKWFSPAAGLIGALLFALSPVAIIYSHSSWNPNPMPFFALLSVWGIYEVWQKHSFRCLPWVGVSFAFALQMHYLGLILIPTLGIFWLLTLLNVKKDPKMVRAFWVKTIWAFVIFLMLMSPLVLFDLKHQGQNLNAFKTFFADRQTTINVNPARSDRYLPAIQSVTSELLLGRQMTYSTLTAFIIALVSIWAYLGKPKARIVDFLKSKKDPALSVVFTWIFFGILGLGVYKQHIYAHYFGFLFPAVYLLVGYLISFLWKKGIIFKILSAIYLIFLIYFPLLNSPLRFEPNRQLSRTEAAVDLIIKESTGEPFNFALIAKQNYDESYRYFFENKKSKMFRGEDLVTEQLFIICEDGDTCAPEGHSQYQIAIFGIAKIDREWKLDHLRIYRLIHPKQ